MKYKIVYVSIRFSIIFATRTLIWQVLEATGAMLFIM